MRGLSDWNYKMKLEPLKNKMRPFQLYMEATTAFTIDDVKSAVEWLKEEIRKKSHKPNKLWFLDKIDETFEDVIKK